MARNEDQDAYDAATVAILRATDRKGLQRELLSGLTPEQQREVFAAEKRFLDRMRARK
jgi:hypothetical protein